jgi:membrane-associated phospholipid phosphatase
MARERSSTKLVLFAGAAALTVVAARLLAAVPPRAWELSLFHGINGRGDVPSPFWWPVMQFGSLGGALLLTLAVALVWDRRLGVLVGAATGLAWSVAELLKSGIGRPRPGSLGIDLVLRSPEATGTGFPSGHAAVVFAASVVMLACISGWWRLLPIGVATFVALARVYVGVHLPLDVVGGAAVGVVVGLLVRVASTVGPWRQWVAVGKPGQREPS